MLSKDGCIDMELGRLLNIVDDVRPFLDTTADASLLTRDNLDRLLSNAG